MVDIRGAPLKHTCMMFTLKMERRLAELLVKVHPKLYWNLLS